MSQEKTKVKHEKWQDVKGLKLDVYWMKEDEAVIFGFNSKDGVRMKKDEMEEEGFLKQ